MKINSRQQKSIGSFYLYTRNILNRRGQNHPILSTDSNQRNVQSDGIKSGIKLFKEREIEAMYKEFNQLDRGATPNKPVVLPSDPTKLTSTKKKEALEAVNLNKEKRTGTIRGRTSANGRKQRSFLKDGEEFTSPTISLEAIFRSLVIDVHEGRDIAIFDIPGSYLHAEMPEDKQIILKVQDKFVDIMCDVNKKHRKNVVIENGNIVLYMKGVGSIYRCIQYALMLYDLYANTLNDMVFEIYSYDKCI